MSKKNSVNLCLSFLLRLGGIAGSLFSRKKKLSADELRRADFPTGTQKMGVAYTDKIRDVFRFKWLRQHR